MATVIFVHGTGARGEHARRLASKVEQALRARAPTIRTAACLWGDRAGARLRLDGSSVPTYAATRALGEPEAEDDQIALWAMLETDPFFEIRHLVALRAGQRKPLRLGVASPGKVVEDRLRALEPEGTVRAALEDGELAGQFRPAIRKVLDSREGRDLLRDADDPLDLVCVALARATIALAMALAEDADQPARASYDAAVRDVIVSQLADVMQERARSLLGKVLAPVTGTATWLATFYAKRKRGAVTDAAYPFAADILLYQARGDPIRDCIRDSVEEAEAPVVLLAHSLGGIACVDLLSARAMPKVALLVTIGSQAPFLYELGALPALPFGEKLPEHFPLWLNVYDLRDVLSYVGADVFPGRVEDVKVDNRQSFPKSHSAYWDNPATWDAIVPRLP